LKFATSQHDSTKLLKKGANCEYPNRKIKTYADKMAKDVIAKYVSAFRDDRAYFELWGLTEMYLKDSPALGAREEY